VGSKVLDQPTLLPLLFSSRRNVCHSERSEEPPHLSLPMLVLFSQTKECLHIHHSIRPLQLSERYLEQTSDGYSINPATGLYEPTLREFVPNYANSLIANT
jgi:hypothetical protein